MGSGFAAQNSFQNRPAVLYDCVMDDVTLPPELERFAEEAVAAGRFRDLSAVVAAGVSLLRRQEQARADFVASLEAAETEAARDGWHSLDEILAEADHVIAAKRAAV
jgi:putative addiction module CopG family antidote